MTETLDQASDEQLASLGDLVALHGRYARRLFAFLAGKGVPRSDLDDAAQEIWTRVWNVLKKKGFAGHFRGWLFQVAGNHAIDLSRKKRPAALPDDAPSPKGGDPAEELAAQEERDRLRECVGRLSDMQAEVFRRRMAGEKPERIAAELGLEADRVHRRLHDAKKAVEECVRGRAS